MVGKYLNGSQGNRIEGYVLDSSDSAIQWKTSVLCFYEISLYSSLLWDETEVKK
jgi:hypothetical protein